MNLRNIILSAFALGVTSIGCGEQIVYKYRDVDTGFSFPTADVIDSGLEDTDDKDSLIDVSYDTREIGYDSDNGFKQDYVPETKNDGSHSTHNDIKRSIPQITSDKEEMILQRITDDIRLKIKVFSLEDYICGFSSPIWQLSDDGQIEKTDYGCFFSWDRGGYQGQEWPITFSVCNLSAQCDYWETKFFIYD